MSRLSDILGVKEGQEFRFNNNDTIYKMIGNVLYYYRETADIWSEYYGFTIYNMIAHPELIKIVPEKITLTEQQITAIKGRIAEGTPWVARDKDSEKVWFYEGKPTECGGVGYNIVYGFSTTSLSGVLSGVYDFITFENSPIYLPDLIKE